MKLTSETIIDNQCYSKVKAQLFQMKLYYNK